MYAYAVKYILGNILLFYDDSSKKLCQNKDMFIIKELIEKNI